jgi:hypothetical protein
MQKKHEFFKNPGKSGIEVNILIKAYIKKKFTTSIILHSGRLNTNTVLGIYYKDMKHSDEKNLFRKC